MKFPNLARAAAFALCLATGSAVMAGPSVPNPELDLSPDLLSKLLKEKSRQSSIADGIKASTDRGGSGSSSECGTVNINSNNSNQSVSGIKQMFGKQSTTIITGPVINAANCK